MKARRELHPAGCVPDLAVRYYSFLMHCLICCNACYCRHNDCDKSKQHISRLFLHRFKLLLLLYSRISCYSLRFSLSVFAIRNEPLHSFGQRGMKCTPKISAFPKIFQKNFWKLKKPSAPVRKQTAKHVLNVFNFQFLFLCFKHFAEDIIYCIGVSSLSC